MTSPLPAVAIVGISAELPGGTSIPENLDHKEFFEFLLNKGEAYEDVPADRFNIDAWHGSGLGQVVGRQAAFLKNISLFDHAEFGIAAKDANATSLSTRKLLEHAFLALQDSGIDSRGQNVGVYSAGTAFDQFGMGEHDPYEARGILTGIPSMISNKVSYHLDLTGPSVPVDTACSSSLTALHLAIQALRGDECDAAVVGSSQLNHRFIDYVHYAQSNTQAPDGKCKPFDATADGFGRGEGVIVIVVKLLEHALRDGDHIYASVLGSAINGTGSIQPIYSPVGDAQRKAMERAWKQTAYDPKQVDFLELHATGTAAGDPTEANWVGSLFGREDQPVTLGSVKGNIGHLEISAFLASLSKVLSVFETGTIPANVNLKELNPAIHWKEFNLEAPTENVPLTARSGTSLVAMTSSGIGGSNGSVVLSAPPKVTYDEVVAPTKPVLLVAGGLSPSAATEMAGHLAASNLAEQANLLSSTYGRRARQMTWRTFATYTPGQKNPVTFPAALLSPKVRPPVTFVFCGQGPQHFNMGRQLYRDFPVFKASIDRMDAVYERVTGQSLIRDIGLFGGESTVPTLPDVWPIAITQPSLIIIQMALYDLYCAHGLQPDIVVAHSAGETALMYASGAIPQEMAVEIATSRGLAMRSVEAFGGAMAAVNCTGEQGAELIASIPIPEGTVLDIGCYNGPEALTLSGSDENIDKVVEAATALGYFARKIKTRVAGHSKLMERCQVDYMERMNDIYTRYASHGPFVPKRTTYSTQTGGHYTKAFSPEYMWTNARAAVRFAEAVTAIHEAHPNSIYIEISPHPVLVTYVAACGVKPDMAFCPIRRSKNPAKFAETNDFLASIGKAVSLGFNKLDWAALNGKMPTHTVSVPAYPFNKKDIAYRTAHVTAAVTAPRNGPLNFKGMAVNVLTHPDLGQHIIMGEPIMPATAYLEMMFEEGATHMWNVEFSSMLPLLKEKVLRVDIETADHKWDIKSWAPDQLNPTSKRHAGGFFSRGDLIPAPPVLDVKAIAARCTPLPVKGFYDSISYFAQYGPVFRQIRSIWAGNNESMVEINTSFHESDTKYIINPAILDSCLHVLIHPAFTGDADQSTYYLPSNMREVFLHTRGPIPTTLFAYAKFKEWNPHYLKFDIFIIDAQGNAICSMFDAQISKHGVSPDEPVYNMYETEWQPLTSTKLNAPIAPVAATDYSFLDALVEAPEVESSYGRVLEAVKANKATPVEILSEISYPTDAVIAQVRQIFDHFTAQGKTVASILEIGNVSGTLSARIAALKEEYSDIAITTSTSGFVAPGGDISGGLSSMPFDLNKDIESNNLAPWSFDIIVGTHALGFVEDLPRTLGYLHDLLVPGGFLVISEANGGAAPGASYIDAVFAPKDTYKGLNAGKDYQRFDASTWSSALNGAKFAASGANAETFFVTRAQRDSLEVINTPASFASENLHIVSYPEDPVNALSLYPLVSSLEGSAVPQTLWFESTFDTLPGSASRGFTRSLRQEGLDTDIRLTLFDASFSAEKRQAIIRYFAQFEQLEKEVRVDASGNLFVPRIVFRAAPAEESSTELPQQWKLDAASGSLSPSMASAPPAGVLVEIDSASSFGPLRAVVGTVQASRSASFPVGTRVAGITTAEVSNVAAFFEGEVAKVPAGADAHATSALVIPCSYLTNPERLKGQNVFVAADDVIAPGIQAAWKALSLDPAALVSSPEALPSASIVVATAGTDAAALQALTSHVSPSASTFIWDNAGSGLYARVQKEKYLAGDVLAKLLPSVSAGSSVLGKAPQEYLPSEYQVSAPVLFSPEKFYMLVGGIGSLGIHLALWMYTRGARRIVLTSRSGAASMNSPIKYMLNRVLNYIKALPDIDLRLEACDSLSEEQTTKLIAGFDRPLGGAVFLPAILVDGLFMSFGPGSPREKDFNKTIISKISAFEVLEKVVDIAKLDFFVSTSSAMSFGSAGQTNYSGANTALEWMTGKYRNGFTLVAPGITDSTFGVSQFTVSEPHSLVWLKWAMSSQHLAKCVEDGLKRMRTRNFETYVPDFDWDAVNGHLGVNPLYRHLLTPVASVSLAADDFTKMEGIVLAELHLEKSELDPAVPLTSYGLDSLSASRLSSALKPLFVVTQLQLLADVTLNDLDEKRKAAAAAAEASVGETATAGEASGEKAFDWKEVNGHGDNLVKLVIGKKDDVPLILIHGGDGSAMPFQPLQLQFNTALWAIQYTTDTPMASFEELTQFYYDEIKRARPEGPYRLGAFSAGCVFGLEVARKLEANGDKILQMCWIDHFPLLYSSPLLAHETRSGVFGPSEHDSAVRQVLALLRNDKNDNWTNRDPAAPRDKQYSQQTQMPLMVKKTGSVMMPWLKKTIGEASSEEDRQARAQRLLGGMIDEIKAPKTVYLAGRGIQGLMKELAPNGEWDDFGASRLRNPVECVYYDDEGHFSMFSYTPFSEALEKSYTL
ncbi:putative polyketide synthase [Roridomyces roridus]|uniref:Polyketide synthase n=1 Tax=Roridomyces roridus TaxID=1738132 RepID=A0AAD7C8Q4_9AGAR|nr:putative polyketide synthase [Roridomyces roridus]